VDSLRPIIPDMMWPWVTESLFQFELRSKHPYDRLQVCSEPSNPFIPSIVGSHGAGAGQPKLRTRHSPCHGTCTPVLWVMARVTAQTAPNGPRVPIPMLFLAIVLP